MRNYIKNNDENISASLEVVKDNGVIYKGILNKQKYYDFLTILNIENPRGCKIKSVQGYYFNKNTNDYEKLTCSKQGTVKQLIPTNHFNGNNARIKYVIEYKVGMLTSKKLTITCNAVL
jgi:hypothetical protein